MGFAAMTQSAAPATALFGEQFVADWHANAARLAGTYDDSQEHDACGVGLVAALDTNSQARCAKARANGL